jgi:hypothetical protein
MNPLKKGPELKMPELKVPDFVADVFYDLHDRRLLAPIALAVVAIVAVPFLLGGGSKEPPAGPGAGAGISSAEAESGETASLTVVEAKPGLRDYRKRLAGRTPTDPFEQRYTAPHLGGSESGSPAESSSSSSEATKISTETTSTGKPASAPSSNSSPDETSSGSGGGNTGGAGSPSQLPPGSHLFGFRPDVRFGVAGSDDLAMHEELRLGSFLPHKDPVAIFIGATQDGKQALFDVSPAVRLVQGDGNCVGGQEHCGILSMQEGQAVTLSTESGTAFRLAVVRIRFVEIHVPKEASASSAAPVAPGLGVVGQFEMTPQTPLISR